MTILRGAGIMLATMTTMAAGSAMAQDTVQAATQGPADGGSTISVAVTAGTLGIGPEAGWRFSDHVGIRGNATFLGFSRDLTVDDNDYNAELKLKSFGAMVDVHPFGGSFRVSGGARINRNRAGLSGDFSRQGSVEIDDVTYSGAQVGILTGRARVKKVAPALTLGWACAASRPDCCANACPKKFSTIPRPWPGPSRTCPCACAACGLWTRRSVRRAACCSTA